MVSKPAPYVLGDAITRRSHARPYDPFERRLEQHIGGSLTAPVHRRLAVYTQDPSTPGMDVAFGEAVIPYEPLSPGPEGCVVRVVDVNESTGEHYQPLDLDQLAAPYPTGLKPSTADPKFAQQMTYAVAMATYERFRQALGRTPDFSFPSRAVEDGTGPAAPGSNEERSLKLDIYPHGMEEDNAYYDAERGALLFGYTFANRKARGLEQEGMIIFTSLSHDVVVHEMTHALLDGQRAKFMLPTNGDVGAFHEAFSDMVALFQRFQYRDLVKRGIEDSPPGELSSRLLTDIARQWGRATGDGVKALRTALLAAGGPDTEVPDEHRYANNHEEHDLGGVLEAAVFDAFRWIFARKTARLRSLAIPGAALRAEQVDLLVDSATKLAGQFLNIIIRAVDYCPPVDVTFGEYLRAMVTADFDLVPEDPWGYREALVRAFRRYGIVVDQVSDLSEESLLWRPPDVSLTPIAGLDFTALRHRREPGQIAARSELIRRGEVLGNFLIANPAAFGLAPPRRGEREVVEASVIESIRTLRRIGPDGTLNLDLAAEVLQRRRAVGRRRWFYGGSTVIIDSAGAVRYAINKSLDSRRREDRTNKFLAKAPRLYSVLLGDDNPGATRLMRHLHRPRRQAPKL